MTFLNALAATLFFKSSSDQTELIIKKLSSLFGQELLVLWLLVGFGFFLSSWLASSRQGIGVSLGIVFGIYLLGILSVLTKSFSWLENWAFIHRTVPSKLLTNPISFAYGVVLFGLGIFFFSLGYIHYTKKDLTNK